MGMRHLTFSEILQTILSINKTNNKTTGWVKQEATVNSIFQVIGVPGKADEEFYVNTSDCSKYFNGRKNIPNKIRKFIAKQPFTELAEIFADKINHHPDIPATAIATALFEQAKQGEISSLIPTCTDDIRYQQEQTLNQLFSKKLYAQYISTTILFSLLYVSNIDTTPSVDFPSQEILHFNSDVEECIQLGQYYKSYERDVIIYPDIETKLFKVLVTRTFEAPLPNPVHKYKDKYLVNFLYSTPTLRSNLHFVSLKINGKDYTDATQVIDETLDSENHSFPYKRSILLENIEPANTYKVELQTKYFASFPVRFGSFRLHAPAKRFKVSVCIRTIEKRKLSLTMKTFGSYNKHVSNIHHIEPNATLAYFENIDWTFPSSGYAYIVKPWNEYWLDFLPDREKSTET